jgi:hypothetical protein
MERVPSKVSGREPGCSTGRPTHQPRPVAAHNASKPQRPSISTPMRLCKPCWASTCSAAFSSSDFSAGNFDSGAPASRAIASNCER